MCRTKHLIANHAGIPNSTKAWLAAIIKRKQFDMLIFLSFVVYTCVRCVGVENFQNFCQKNNWVKLKATFV